MPKRPIGERDEQIGLESLLRDDGRGGHLVHTLDLHKLLERVGCALQSNADDSLSVLLHVLEGRDERAWLQDPSFVRELVVRAVDAEAAECLLMLLNAVRKAEEDGAATLSDVELLRIARDRTPQHHLPECEVWGRAFAVEDGGTLRCVRVLLLHCMRQQASRPLRYKVKRQGGKVTKELDLVVSGAEHELNERGEWEIVPGGETVRVVWPKTPRDFSTEMCEAKGCKAGGFDLSDGAEPQPVEWVNAIDGQTPPPFVYVARCVAADVHPEWMREKARPCNLSDGAECKEAVGGSSSKRSLHLGEGSDHQRRLFSGLPGRVQIGQCNWSCRCSATSEGRTMQRGVGLRLQVFYHEGKGWCLRTLSPISKGDFVMEYVGERVSAGGPQGGERRRREDRAPDMGSYEMDPDDKMSSDSQKKVFIDAFHVRSIAAFAAFACTKKKANMSRKMWLGEHWDRHFVHVVFSATEDVPAGAELTYMRTNEGDPRSDSTYNCKCGDAECSKRY